jgi:hypothetical protein
LELDPRATSSIHLTLLITSSIQLSKNKTEAKHFIAPGHRTEMDRGFEGTTTCG